MLAAASARLCVETELCRYGMGGNLPQPPPRGCVLKQLILVIIIVLKLAAASARLCVETVAEQMPILLEVAAASARLCVETLPDVVIG